MNTQPLKELRFYLIDPHFPLNMDEFTNYIPDDEFMTIAEDQGMVYSLEEFQTCFNKGEISDQCFLRIIEREYYL